MPLTLTAAIPPESAQSRMIREMRNYFPLSNIDVREDPLNQYMDLRVDGIRVAITQDLWVNTWDVPSLARTVAAEIKKVMNGEKPEYMHLVPKHPLPVVGI